MSSKQAAKKVLESSKVKQPIKISAPTTLPPLDKHESSKLHDKPSTFISALFNSLKFFENKNSSIDGKTYIFAAIILFTIILWVKRYFLTKLPTIEVIFFTFLITFILNYCLTKGILHKTPIESQSNHTLIKVSGAYAVGTIISFFSAVKFTQLPTALLIFYSAFFLVTIAQAIFRKRNYYTSDFAFASVALISIIMIVTEGSSNPLIIDSNFLYGFGLSAASGVFMALIVINLDKTRTESFITINRIIAMIVVLFLPISFPIQGIVVPNLYQCTILIVLGLLVAFASLLFIKSFQVETHGKLEVFLFLLTVCIFAVERVLGGAFGLIAFVGALVTIGCVVVYPRINN